MMIYDDDQNITNNGFDLKQSFSRILWSVHSATSAIDRLFQIKSIRITFIIQEARMSMRCVIPMVGM